MDFADLIRAVIKGARTLGHVEPEKGQGQVRLDSERLWSIKDVTDLVETATAVSKKLDPHRKRAA